MDHFGQKEEEELSPLAIGAMWSSRILSLAIEMALITLGGYWLDRQLHTLPLFVILGAIFAMAVLMTQLLHIAKNTPK